MKYRINYFRSLLLFFFSFNAFNHEDVFFFELIIQNFDLYYVTYL